MKTRITMAAAMIAAGVCVVHADEQQLEERIAALEKEVAELKAALAPVIEQAETEQIVAGQRDAARRRMRRDAEVYSRDELQEIENLYQVANKQWNSQEGKDSLKELIEKYGHANRTGCALLYLGQMSRGEERESFLRRAINDFSDCYYGDGVQVGAYARYYLAHHYEETGDADKAAELFSEIREQYPNAIDHKARLLRDMIE